MPNGKPTVLLAEDDPFMTALVAEGLEGAGFSVLSATNGEEAVRRFAEAKPDALLLDVLLPKKSGLEALAEIRGLPGGSGVPVLILSNIEDAGYIREAERLGVVAYLIKANMQIPDIVAKVKEAIGRTKS